MAKLTLVLEASTPTASVALIEGDRAIGAASVDMRARDGERLLPAVVELLRSTGRSTTELSRIACSSGPGGFTGLRIAAAIGKGLAESLGVPLYGVSSLALLAAGDGARDSSHTDGVAGGAADGAADGVADRAADGAGARGQVLAVLDAMRDEWYVQHFTRDVANGSVAHGAVHRAISAVARLTRPAIEAMATRTGAMVVGVGGGTFPGGREATPRAPDIVALTEGLLYAPVDLASWEPDYGRLAEAQVKWEATHGRALGERA